MLALDEKTQSACGRVELHRVLWAPRRTRHGTVRDPRSRIPRIQVKRADGSNRHIGDWDRGSGDGGFLPRGNETSSRVATSDEPRTSLPSTVGVPLKCIWK